MRAAATLLILTLLAPGPALMSQSAPHAHPPLPTAEQLAALPPDGGLAWNRLVFEKSPYLLLHAHNPVDWWPWGDAAFERARAEDKPVFLSIGYSTCHWCHVMARESFEDAEVARLLNEHFICVKLDREERPDVDAVYMQVTMAMSGHGGWPMTVLLTPDREPFFAGTYFPKRGRANRPGMMELLPAVATAWRDGRDNLLRVAGDITAQLEGFGEQSAGGDDLEASVFDAALAQYRRTFDPVRGGFGGGRTKFPVPHNLLWLMRHHRRTASAESLAMVEATLAHMRRGGIWDHVGGGFHRYSTDQDWLLPHFEKMLYDQALLALAYTEAHQLSGKPEYAATARDILAYVERDLTRPGGGYFSAEDAESEGVEGKWYLWTPAELEAVLGADDAAFVTRVFNVTKDGNFEEEATGRKTGESILHLTASTADLATQLKVDEAVLVARVESCRAKLFAARELRPRPRRDDKVLTDWNGLMIAAMARAGRVFNEPRYTDSARAAAAFIQANLTTPDGRLIKRYRDGQAAMTGLLDDYAFLAWGHLELYEATFDPAHLAEAIRLCDLALLHFADTKNGGFFQTPNDGEKLIARLKEVYDGAVPSGNAVMALNLVRLARMTGRTQYEDHARATMRAFSPQIEQAPMGHAMMLMALELAEGPAVEVVVAGDLDDPETRTIVDGLRAMYLPHGVLLHRPAGEAGRIGELAPFVAEQKPIAGKPTIYVCRNFACALPVHTLDEAKRLIEATASAR